MMILRHRDDAGFWNWRQLFTHGEFSKTSIVSSSSSLYIYDISQLRLLLLTLVGLEMFVVDTVTLLASHRATFCFKTFIFWLYMCTAPIGWRDQNWRKPVGRDQRRVGGGGGKQSFPFLSLPPPPPGAEQFLFFFCFFLLLLLQLLPQFPATRLLRSSSRPPPACPTSK